MWFPFKTTSKGCPRTKVTRPSTNADPKETKRPTLWCFSSGLEDHYGVLCDFELVQRKAWMGWNRRTYPVSYGGKASVPLKKLLAPCVFFWAFRVAGGRVCSLEKRNWVSLRFSFRGLLQVGFGIALVSYQRSLFFSKGLNLWGVINIPGPQNDHEQLFRHFGGRKSYLGRFP